MYSTCTVHIHAQTFKSWVMWRLVVCAGSVVFAAYWKMESNSFQGHLTSGSGFYLSGKELQGWFKSQHFFVQLQRNKTFNKSLSIRCRSKPSTAPSHPGVLWARHWEPPRCRQCSPPSAPRLGGSPYIVSTVPIYGAFLILFQAPLPRSLSYSLARSLSLSWVISQGAPPFPWWGASTQRLWNRAPTS